MRLQEVDVSVLVTLVCPMQKAVAVGQGRATVCALLRAAKGPRRRAQHVTVVDAVRSGHHGVDQGQHLAPGCRVTGHATKVEWEACICTA